MIITMGLGGMTIITMGLGNSIRISSSYIMKQIGKVTFEDIDTTITETDTTPKVSVEPVSEVKYG